MLQIRRQIINRINSHLVSLALILHLLASGMVGLVGVDDKIDDLSPVLSQAPVMNTTPW